MRQVREEWAKVERLAYRAGTVLTALLAISVVNIGPHPIDVLAALCCAIEFMIGMYAGRRAGKA